jgi:muramoyltetrapeptide carboxypeptidase
MKPLKPGDTVAVISPAAPSPPSDLVRGVSFLEHHGLRVKLMPHADNRLGYLAGHDADRLHDLHAAFADPNIDAILCARGGYGCARLLPGLDLDLIAAHPKPLIGFSDVTVLLTHLYQAAGVRGFYGPMLTSNLITDAPFSWEHLWRLISGQTPTPYDIANADAYTCLVPGTAQGPLIGGNLSLLASLCGTPYQPQTAGHILFIEDWKEQYYTLDRQFTQLRQAGLLSEIAGLLLCDFSHINEADPHWDLTEQLRRLTADLDVPVGFGFSVGHGDVTATLPIGVKAQFQADAGRLTVLASPFSKTAG